MKRSALTVILCGAFALLCVLATHASAGPVVTVPAPAVTVALDAGAPVAPAAETPQAASPGQNGSAAPVVAPAAAQQPSVIDPPAAPDVSAIQKLWRSGAFLGAGILALYLLLTLAGSIDPRRALLWTGGAAALGTTVDTIMGTGASPNLSMLITAGVAFSGIVAKYRSLMTPPAGGA